MTHKDIMTESRTSLDRIYNVAQFMLKSTTFIIIITKDDQLAINQRTIEMKLSMKTYVYCERDYTYMLLCLHVLCMCCTCVAARSVLHNEHPASRIHVTVVVFARVVRVSCTCVAARRVLHDEHPASRIHVTVVVFARVVHVSCTCVAARRVLHDEHPAAVLHAVRAHHDRLSAAA